MLGWRSWPTVGSCSSGPGVYILFLVFWLPQNTFYRLFYLPPLVLLVGRWIPQQLHRSAPLLIVLLVWNLTFLAYPNSRVESNEPLEFALAEQRRWPAGTGVVLSSWNTDLWTIAYFNPQAAWISMPKIDLASLEQVRRGVRSVWLTQGACESIAQSPEGRQWLASRLDRNVHFCTRKHDFRFYRLRPPAA